MESLWAQGTQTGLTPRRCRTARDVDGGSKKGLELEGNGSLSTGRKGKLNTNGKGQLMTTTQANVMPCECVLLFKVGRQNVLQLAAIY
ncbi:hypothetical protein NQZ68_000594 [Dissostichus eleginoides]|nr:hypothetical protein NQZ68_000591 [Dissostichus eleginoides]KAI9531100.1 hypothetical protein NQZ68_000594 [Dissostichus eleginoides]